MKPPARWWGLRHVRYVWYAWRVRRWARLWGELGSNIGLSCAADVRHLEDIWYGRA